MSSFLTDFVKSTVSKVITSSGINAPFTVGDKIEMQGDNAVASIWSLHKGVKKDDGSQISVFAFDCNRQRNLIPLARNTLKRAKTLRHPDLIKFIDFIENENYIYIATEPVIPLSNFLRTSNNDHNLISWGLYKAANAIKFINADCNLIHANIRIGSIYCTQAGEWRLGGLELLCSLQEPSPVIYEYGNAITDGSKYQPPEVRRGGWSVVRTQKPSSIDAWEYGCLIYELFNGPLSRPEQLMTKGQIPDGLFQFYKSFLDANPHSRADLGQFIEFASRPGNYFDNDFTRMTLFLEQMAVKDAGDKEKFIRKLIESIDKSSFPPEFLRYKVLPQLSNAIEFGAAPPKLLAPILKIAAGLSAEEYERDIVGLIVKLFALTDRAVRVSLCENMALYVDQLKDRVINDKIWPNLSLGFNDTSPVIRECTVKSILLIIPKLSERIVNNDLLRYLAKMQTDEEPGIRTNTTICLGKMSKHLSESTRRKVLIPAFARALHDQFPPSRNAGLLALAATAEYYEPTEIATRVLPCITPLLLDSEKSIRVQAFKAVDTFLKKLEKVSATMPETSAPISAPVSVGSSAPQQNVSSPNASVVSPRPPTSFLSASSSQPPLQQQQPPAGAQGDGWGNWAGSAVSAFAGSAVKKIVGTEPEQTTGNNNMGSFGQTSSNNMGSSMNMSTRDSFSSANVSGSSSTYPSANVLQPTAVSSFGSSMTPATNGMGVNLSSSTNGAGGGGGGMKLPKKSNNPWEMNNWDEMVGGDDKKVLNTNSVWGGKSNMPAPVPGSANTGLMNTNATNVNGNVNGNANGGWDSWDDFEPSNKVTSPKPFGGNVNANVNTNGWSSSPNASSKPVSSAPPPAATSTNGWDSWDNNDWGNNGSNGSNGTTFKVQMNFKDGNKPNNGGKTVKRNF